MQRSQIGTLVMAMLLGACCFTSNAAYAIVLRSGADDAAYVALGNETAYSSVGRFDGSTTSSSFLASGTLIAPDWVLTAAHVVDNAKSLSFSIGGETYTADKMIANPNWNGNVWSGYDIGLVHLSKPVKNVAPAVLYTGKAELNQVDTMVGFGKTGNGYSGSNLLDGQKRGAQNVINEIDNSRLLLSDFSNPKPLNGVASGVAKSLPLEGLIAPGDSGGGLFITTPKGTYLAGVNSFVGSDFGAPNSGYGDFSGHTRVSAFANWIEGLMNDPTAGQTTVQSVEATAASFNAGNFNAGNSAGTLPAFVVAVPEPGSLGLLAVAGLLLHLSRRILRPAKSAK